MTRRGGYVEKHNRRIGMTGGFGASKTLYSPLLVCIVNKFAKNPRKDFSHPTNEISAYVLPVQAISRICDTVDSKHTQNDEIIGDTQSGITVANKNTQTTVKLL